MYGVTCPLASECTKGGHYFKSPDPEKAIKMLANHLKTSTYHLGAGKISAEQVDDLMETIVLEEWDEEVWDHTNGEGQFESHHGAWAASRKRKNVQAEIPEGAELTRIAKMHRQTPMQIQQAFCGGPPIVRKRMPSRTLVDIPIDAQVTMNGAQIQTIMDSISRARGVVGACINIAEKAAKWFSDELDSLDQLQLCIATYLTPSGGGI